MVAPAALEAARRTPPLVIVVHAFGGRPNKFWYPALAAHVAEATVPGARAEVLTMTRAYEPTIDAWTEDLARRLLACEAGQPVYLVGHSVGCQTIARVLGREASHPQAAAVRHVRVVGLCLVAAWLSVDDPWDTISPWCTAPLPLEAARATLRDHHAHAAADVVLSDNDRYTADYTRNGAAWTARMGAHVTVVADRGHFGGRKQAAVFDLITQRLRAWWTCVAPATPS